MKSDAPMDRLLRQSFEQSAAVEPEPCPDAETIAAWADRALDARQRAAVESHAASCARCQGLLAMMMRTADRSPVGSTPRIRVLGWLVPLAAAAAVLVVWIRAPHPPALPAPAQRPATEAMSAPPAPPPAATAPRQEFRSAEAPLPGATTHVAGSTPVGSTASGNVPAEQQLQDRRAANQRGVPSAAPVERSRDAAASLEAKAERADDAGVTIPSPDPQVLWRVVAGRVQRSTDGGGAWQPQSTGADSLLTAGAAPAPAICWAVGRQGAVTLTTDGASWRRLPSPDPGATFVAVQASDDKSAIVTAADGRRFRTTDGGMTWATEPPQEIPAAPF
jgi:hypothetical protein